MKHSNQVTLIISAIYSAQIIKWSLFLNDYLLSKKQGITNYSRTSIMINNSLICHFICLNPAIIQIEFVYAAYNSIYRVFSESEISGCLFHFGKVIWRKLRDLRSILVFHKSCTFRWTWKLMPALLIIHISLADLAWQYSKTQFSHKLISSHRYWILSKICVCIIRIHFSIQVHGFIMKI